MGWSLLIDIDDGDDFADLQSEKRGAQRTGVCRKLRTPKTTPLRGLVHVRHEPFIAETEDVSTTFDANIFDSEFHFILLSDELDANS